LPEIRRKSTASAEITSYKPTVTDRPDLDNFEFADNSEVTDTAQKAVFARLSLGRDPSSGTGLKESARWKVRRIKSDDSYKSGLLELRASTTSDTLRFAVNSIVGRKT
jgi:hypothetical protein